jgi:hypothetical protein
MLPLAIPGTAWASFTAVALACLVLAAASGTASADCVRAIALCALECDQRTKPETPERPQCARTCITNYQRCERTEILQSPTGGQLPSKGNVLSPRGN